MPLRIFNNLASNNAQRSLGNNSDLVKNSIEKVASGQRVTKAADDVASFAISESLRSDTRVLQQASRNANDGVSLLNTAEGALNEISSLIIRLNELASQASTGTIGTDQRQTLQLEFNSLSAEIDRISSTTEFGGQKLIDGSLASSAGNQVTLAVGLDSNSSSLINLNQQVNITAVNTTALGISGIDITSRDSAVNALSSIKSALTNLSEIRGRLGAAQNAVSKTVSTLDTAAVNLTQAESAFRDADISKEFADLTRNQVLLQASSAIVGQANLIPRSVLQLLQ